KDWLLAHYMVLVAKSEKFIRDRLEKGEGNLVKELLDNFNPDILVLNEVMPDISGQVLNTLVEANYHLAIGKTDHHPYPIARTTLIASKFKGQEFPFRLPGNAGGGAVGFEIPELKTIVLAPHPSAFSSKIRKEQLFHVKEVVQRLMSEKPDHEILVVGDFNTDADEIDPIFDELPLVRFSHPSFPSDDIYKQLNKRWQWLKPLIGLNDGQRSFDHVIASSGWNNPKLIPYQTTSDHVALILNFGE
ncbi:MAG: endonuclease/exonuclease/phosphatase family protein, partial [Candidatus Paceibacterota bacterium]